MNKKIVENKYLNALLLLMLFSAMVHMVMLLFLTLFSGNLYFLNYFNIVDASYFLPDFFSSFFGTVISFMLVLAMYFIILKINNIE
ncbi:MAG: hypothetical protein A2908_01505 [Candidatus Staskawiczbacteria bacterium RIFCSPLOWO2_01_FULL_38_12b]|uniref:Uncharacterized protein n=1 Tax=Candidatus Staskawiczbacteria bacterium RIFCSPLOWO2_01_FULL_38_12b TaxID=1802214 RepID=A0A1G2ICQ4_9BACT|nr:MAG: hypothetical protein A2908_01505 [Candidatus Staskawiczbacteria bacterium RIFCSPLOWO2_01_FULL_38_12b]